MDYHMQLAPYAYAYYIFRLMDMNIHTHRNTEQTEINADRICLHCDLHAILPLINKYSFGIKGKQMPASNDFCSNKKYTK